MALTCPNCGNDQNFLVKTLQMHVVQLRESRVEANEEGRPAVIEVLCDECETALNFSEFEEEVRNEVLLTLGARLGAAFGRLVGVTQWLPGRGLSETHLVPDLYQLTLLMPAVIYDFMRRGAVHRSYVIGIALLVVTMLAAHYVATAAWWLAIGRQVIDGVA